MSNVFPNVCLEIDMFFVLCHCEDERRGNLFPNSPHFQLDYHDVKKSPNVITILFIHYSLFTTHYSILTTHYSQLTTHQTQKTSNKNVRGFIKFKKKPDYFTTASSIISS